MTLDYLQLLDSEPIYIDGVGHIVPPTVRAVKRIGVKSYQSKLGVFQITLSDILKDDIVEMFSEIQTSEICTFDIMLLSKELTKILLDALSFFMFENIVVNKDGSSLSCYDIETKELVGEINRDNFNVLCDLILQLNFLGNQSSEKLKPKNKKAEQIMKRLQNAPQKRDESKSISIGEIVAAICANVDTYKYSEIWSLTVYQLYDLFFRLKLRKQTDIIALRWAAWSSEPFDFDLWCKNIKT